MLRDVFFAADLKEVILFYFVDDLVGRTHTPLASRVPRWCNGARKN
jgi:hypothetical protein